MDKNATLTIGENAYKLDMLEGTESESAVDISQLRKLSKVITFDDGYGNTGSCESKVTFIDGDKGILRYRGYDIADLAINSNFLESSYLVIYGELPNASKLEDFRKKINEYSELPAQVIASIKANPENTHPMGVLASALQALGGAYPQFCTNDRAKDMEVFDETAALIISTVRTIAATRHRFLKNDSLPSKIDSDSYCESFLNMMFGTENDSKEIPAAVINALDLIFLLHADHEQNCSTSTCRMIASGGANPFASLAGGVSALWLIAWWC